MSIVYLNRSRMDKNIAAPVRMMWANAPKLPGLFKMQMKLFSWLARKYPKFYVKMILREFSETDRTVYERLNIAELIQVDRNEGYRQGGIGTWYDAMIPGNWPIPLNEIKTKVYLWHGEEDISVPLSMGQYMAEKLPIRDRLRYTIDNYITCYHNFSTCVGDAAWQKGYNNQKDQI